MLLRKIVNIIIKYYCINKKQVIVFELGCLLRLKMALNVYSLRLSLLESDIYVTHILCTVFEKEH